MDERIVEIVSRLDAARAALHTTLEQVAEEFWDPRPGEGRWSVLEVLDHLVRVEGRVIDLLSAAVANAAGPLPAPEGAVRPHTVDLARLVDRGRRVQTPEALAPREAPHRGRVVDELERARVRSLEFARTASPDALAAIEHAHFAIGTLTGLQWLDFIGAHERRHTAQIVECVEQLRGASA